MPMSYTKVLIKRRAVACLVALSPMAALAQSDAPATASADAWRFSVGAGVISSPKYPGSSERKTNAVPLLSAAYGRFFLGGVPGAGVPVGLGVNLVDGSQWKFGVGLGVDIRKPRRESDSTRLTGLGDVPSTAHGAVFGSYTQDWFVARASLRTDVGGKHEGTLGTLDLEGRYAVAPNLLLTAGPGLTYADSHYTQTFFGIDSGQSARSGLATYSTGAGLNSLRFSVGADYRLTPRWFVGARATAVSLRGDARHSPITEDTSQPTFGIFGGYRF